MSHNFVLDKFDKNIEQLLKIIVQSNTPQKIYDDNKEIWKYYF